MAFEQLSGPQKKILRMAVLSAFEDEAKLDMFLSDRLNKPPLRNFVGALPFDEQVFKLIGSAQAVGWTEALVGALQQERPDNILVRNLPDALRVTASEALEKIVKGAGFVDFRPWTEKIVGIGQAVARIECPANGGVSYGTGILIADDLILTNYHVVEDHITDKLNSASIRCRFDYARDAKGLDQGRQVPLAAGASWIVAYSPYDPADLTGVGVPASDHLDFALLRLAEPVGAQNVDGGVPRGTVMPSQKTALPKAADNVFIVQHPEGEPMQMAIGAIKGAIKEDVKPTDIRVRYDTDTLPGSSGSGVFDQRLDLIALHHVGDPHAKLKPLYNQGIPTGKILAQLAGANVKPFWQ
jgi:hypothetical protein